MSLLNVTCTLYSVHHFVEKLSESGRESELKVFDARSNLGQGIGFYSKIGMGTMSENSEFYVAIQGVYKSWTALQLAVSHGFGGPHSAEKAQWLVGATETYFNENDNLEEWEIEEFLGQIMSEEFGTVLEDGSLVAIAKEICMLFGLWSRGNLEELRSKTANLPQVNLGECVSCEDEKMSVSNAADETMESLTLCDNVSSPSASRESDKPCSSSRPTEEDDGWTTVVTRSKSKKK